LKVLLVDDDRPTLRLMSAVLRSQGVAVHASSDPLVGLDLLSAEKPDVIVLDLDMPLMDGRSFFKLARDGGYEGPVIICSAFGAAKASLELGTEAFLSKPFDPDRLVETVLGVASHNSAADAGDALRL
jgi:DNA-binding response OmpR family regulator